MMNNLIVAGIGTGVGKTVVSAILATLFQADYWKPIECGIPSDTALMHQFLDVSQHHIFPPAYSLKAPLSPHHAARLEGIKIDKRNITFPPTHKPLIIEMAGGLLVPLTLSDLSINLFKKWKAHWILVSRHYLGSINHTLLTIEALQARGLPLLGLIFNGHPNPDSEAAILTLSKLPLLARLLPEPILNQETIKNYAKKWRLLRVAPLYANANSTSSHSHCQRRGHLPL